MTFPENVNPPTLIYVHYLQTAGAPIKAISATNGFIRPQFAPPGKPFCA